MADDSALHRWRKALLADGVHEAVHDLPSTARLVGAGLSMYVNPETMKAWPSAASVAVRTGLSERAVRRGFETLEAGHGGRCSWWAAANDGGFSAVNSGSAIAPSGSVAPETSVPGAVGAAPGPASTERSGADA